MKDQLVALLKFAAAGVAMGIGTGLLVYFGSSPPYRLGIALGMGSIPIAFVLIHAGAMAIQLRKNQKTGSGSARP